MLNYFFKLIITVFAIITFLCGCAGSAKVQKSNPFTPEIRSTVVGLQQLQKKVADPYKQHACTEGVALLSKQLTDFTIETPITGSITFIGSKHTGFGVPLNTVIACKENVIGFLKQNQFDVLFAEGFNLPQDVSVEPIEIAKANLQTARTRWQQVYGSKKDTFSLESYYAGIEKDLPRDAYWVWAYQSINPDADIRGLDDRTLVYCYKIAQGAGDNATADLLKHAHFYRTLLEAYSEACTGKKVAILWGPGHTEDCEIFTRRTGIPIQVVTLPGCERSE